MLGLDQYDFFDKAMRERELEQMNTAMHKVNGIYQELAALVDTQQEHIDQLGNWVTTFWMRRRMSKRPHKNFLVWVSSNACSFVVPLKVLVLLLEKRNGNVSRVKLIYEI